jgi:hypothetical protein
VEFDNSSGGRDCCSAAGVLSGQKLLSGGEYIFRTDSIQGRFAIRLVGMVNQSQATGLCTFLRQGADGACNLAAAPVIVDDNWPNMSWSDACADETLRPQRLFCNWSIGRFR